ncbi:lipase family protein, partial [Xanthomonas hortorum]|uniref:lipase family protein n=1 Tax=Xanthomonas hortorum TaxID=56454 RepID=UPI0031C1F305|nr:hemolysin [Xanthomonas hortorum pv. gardneri]
MAKAYRNADTGEVLVSYAGTTQENILDWIVGNIPAGMGGVSAQVIEAIKFYVDVINLTGGGDSSVTSTGHSLGGGLASLMAVFFDRPATVFDQAPFELTALDLPLIVSYKAILETAGYSLPQKFLEYGVDEFLGDREKNVQQIVTAGEVLTFQTGNAMKINGSVKTIDPMVEDVIGWGEGDVLADARQAVDLHSMSLLVGFMNSELFLKAVQDYKEILPRIFLGEYKDVDVASEEVSTLIDLLVQRQILGEGSLDKLASDIK